METLLKRYKTQSITMVHGMNARNAADQQGHTIQEMTTDAITKKTAVDHQSVTAEVPSEVKELINLSWFKFTLEVYQEMLTVVI